jgi:hypothetical protein
VSEDKESSGDSLVDAKRMALKLEMPSDWAFFDRTDFRAWDILVGLQRCFLDPDADPEAVEFLRAIWLGLLGLHPKFRLNVEHPDEGVTFAPLAKLKRHQLATNIAQAIDVAVARGAKLEAEVQAACDEFGLSRREVFRFLKETRERRKEWPQMAELDGYECPWPTPNGYMIDESGRIVPSPATT